MAKIWSFVAKIWLFFVQKLTVLKVFCLKLLNAAINFPNFWFPAIASGTYKFTSGPPSVRPSVRPYVRYSEISESVHSNFLKFGTKLGLSNATEMMCLDFCPKNPV